ncbi:helix-turn-helix domain-containing protein [Massilibacteroides sp.]|uniref:helix-turn-helix domain-containing protein n=1 Tax=Massilibacteroides sp. TaxID=2034766 RepID=UPI0026365C21|nr:helix-turn-helix domain-containing protein [Massilibacteroides sp.]MDD4516211.1 helix-turn-helix domain-containing protein [Massilibacteroides sp.]
MEEFKIIAPSLLLAPYIKHYWFLKAEVSDDTQQRIISDGYISLVFHRGEQMNFASNNALQDKAFLSGQSVGYSDFIRTGKTDMICVTFRPHGARMFFQFPMNELFNRSIAIDVLGSPKLKELNDRLLYTHNTQICVAHIESFLLKYLPLSKEYNFRRMAAVVQSINQGETNIRSLAQICCLSYKQFSRIFAEYIGCNSKDFLRIIRFQRALYFMQTSPQITLTNLAIDCGFYDQPHFVREFKHFSGYSPSEYLSICSPYSDYFV